MAEFGLDEVVSRTVATTVKEMAGFAVSALPSDTITLDDWTWSWVKVLDPRPGMVVIGLDHQLSSKIAAVCFAKKASALQSHEIKDAQAEFTNVIAGRVAQELLQDLGVVSLGIPRNGRGMPDIRNGNWATRFFQVEGRRLVVVISGQEMTASNPTARQGMSTVIIPGDARTPVGSFSGPKSSYPPDATPDRQFIPTQEHTRPITSSDVPLRIGQYRILDQLGAGGMGMVYKAHHDPLNRLVALKVMRPDLAQDKEFTDRFLREGRATANIDHPNVVPVHDAGFEAGQLYLAMRFVPGGDLASLLHRGGILSESRALVILLGCLEGLQAIADSGLIHRDIKPANILLENNGVPRLADLGLARVLTNVDLSAPGAPQGTPAFMSPEQARAQRNLDIRCDIYALGVTLYCMLTAALPFTGDSPYDIVAKVLYQPTPDPRLINPKISPETVAMMMKAMAKDPAARYQGPMEFHEAVSIRIEQLQRTRPATPSGRARTATDMNNYWLRKLFGS